MTTNIRVLLIDDHTILREGYKQLLESSNMSVVGEAGNAEDGYKIFKECSPDVTIVDMSMPGQNGLECIRRITAHDRRARVLVCSMHDDVTLAVKAIQTGAMGYITKSCPSSTMINAIETIMTGKHFFDAELAQSIVLEKVAFDAEVDCFDRLSHQEFAVFKMLADGKSNSDISKALALTPKTVSNYKANMMKKLNIESQRDLFLLAQKRGLLILPPDQDDLAS